jgi:hypothetical protein
MQTHTQMKRRRPFAENLSAINLGKLIRQDREGRLDCTKCVE